MRLDLLNLTNAPTVVHDITLRRKHEDSFLVTQERERSTFERVVEDLYLELSDQDGFFSSLFRTSLSTEQWRVTASLPTRIIFQGLIELDQTEIDRTDAWVRVTAYDVSKWFWRIADTVSVRKYPLPDDIKNSETVTLERILQFNILQRPTPNPFLSIVTALDLGEFQSLPIRAGKIVAGRTRGMYTALLNSTTVGQLMRASEKYYNANFFVDPSSKKLLMRKRGSILNNVSTNVDANIKSGDGRQLKVYISDTEKFDYVHTFYALISPAAPSLTYVESAKGLSPGTYKYRTTSLVFGVETMGGYEAEISLPEGALYTVTVSNVAVGPEGTSRRNIYRTDKTGNSEFYLVGAIGDNLQISTYSDSRDDEDLLLRAVITSVELKKRIRINTASNHEIILGQRVEIGALRIGIDSAGLSGSEEASLKAYAEILQARLNGFHIVVAIPSVTSFEIGLDGTLPAGFRGGMAVFLDNSNVRNPRFGHSNVLYPQLKAITREYPVVKSWIRFNESTNKWDAPKLDNTPNGTTLPDGRVFQVIPELEFLNQMGGRVEDSDQRDIYAFFGAESNLQTIQARWKDMMLTKRRMVAVLTGTDWKIGDSIVTGLAFPDLPQAKFVIERAVNDVAGDETEIEAVSV